MGIRQIRIRFRVLPRWRRAGIRAAAVVAIVVATASCGARWAMKRDMAAYDRDPVTGVVRGTEAVWLHPAKENDKGEAVLLVHGFMGSRKDFNDLGERLAAAGYHVRLMRLPGCGTNPVDCGATNAEALKAAVRQEFATAQAQYGKVSVVGFSMGGVLSTLLASGQGGVERLVLVAPAYGVTHRWYYVLPVEWWDYSIGYLMPYVPRTERFEQVNRPKDEVHLFTYHAMSTASSRTLLKLGREARRPETLAKIKCPVLMIIAPADGAASPSRAAAAFENIGSTDKHAEWLGEDSNHLIFWDYEREKADAAIIEFIKDGTMEPGGNAHSPKAKL